MAQFPEDIALRIRALSIPGNETGRAVRTQDPIAGAFDELEFIALTTRLTELGPELLTTMENTLCWVAIDCGANPLAYALARDEDFKPLLERETGRVHALLNLPRIKKGDVRHRQQFHPRMLNEETGAWVARLVAENQQHRDQQGRPEGCAHPLFRRFDPDPKRLNGPYREYAMHMSSGEVTAAIQVAIGKLGIISHRTGEPLVVTMRRFRRTFASRAVEGGATPTELAVMLDHSDLGSVMPTTRAASARCCASTSCSTAIRSRKDSATSTSWTSTSPTPCRATGRSHLRQSPARPKLDLHCHHPRRGTGRAGRRPSGVRRRGREVSRGGWPDHRI